MKLLDDKIEAMNPKIEGQLLNFGYVTPVLKPKDFVLGGINKMPQVIVNSSGDWSSFYPVFESQLFRNFDTFGCTIYAVLNAMEAYLKGVYGVDFNAAERFNFNLLRIRQPGISPLDALQNVRDYGCIPETLLPVQDGMTFEEYAKPDPMWQWLKDEAKKFGYDLWYETLWVGNISKEQRIEKLKYGRERGTVVLSATAWFRDANGLYVDNGFNNGHAIFHGRDNSKGLEIFDSYKTDGEYIKTLSCDHNIQFAVRIVLTPKSEQEQISWLLRLLDFLLIDVLALKTRTKLENPVIPPATPPVSIDTPADVPVSTETIPKLITRICKEQGIEPELGLAVAECENLRWPGDFFDPKRTLINSPRSIDRGVFMINNFYHPQVTDDQAFDPEFATKWFCQMVKGGNLNAWSASMPCWRNKISFALRTKYKV